ncbi:MAG: hypothetical protein KGL12_09800 [Rhodospirillales bacterium]|nr:hypothetical protein [Rhodospirillales bacterium]
MRGPVLCMLLLGLPGGVAGAAPVPGCGDAAPQASLPLAIDLAGRPGVPAGMTGQIGIAVPVENAQPQGVAAGCDPPPPPVADVLAGPPAADLLTGPEPPSGQR